MVNVNKKVAALVATAVMLGGASVAGSANAASAIPDDAVVVTPNPWYANGPFDGWGTSLAWFANATGNYGEEGFVTNRDGISKEAYAKALENGKQLREAVVAYDALAVIVNPQNPITHLTREQLEAIFRGKVTNWNQVTDLYTGRRGPDLKIIVYSRETSSGTYEFFKTSVLHEKNYMAGVLSMPATGAVIQSVSQTKGAIGYVGMAYVNRNVRAVKVSYDGKHFVYPNMDMGRRHVYPIIRELYYYYTADKAGVVEPFIRFLLSPKGQQIVMKSGYVPVD